MAGKIQIPEGGEKKIVNIAIDLILKVGVLILMIVLCYKILYPFIDILIWGAIIAIVLFAHHYHCPLFAFSSQHLAG